MENQISLLIISMIQLSMPLVLAATGELVSERAGVLNLSLEGMMLVGAFFAAYVTHLSSSPLLGVCGGILATLPIALLQAFLSITMLANQLVVGIGLNLVALGTTTLAYREIFGPLNRVLLPGFPTIHIPFLSDIPFVGTVFINHSGFYYLTLLLTITIWFLLNKTAFGLSIRAVGENPQTVDQAGLSVVKIRYSTVLFAGAMAGLAGSYLSIGYIHTFTENMTNGAGYLAIAAVIFGSWQVWKTVGACMLFGVATALQFQLPGWGVSVPTAWLMMLPYVLALVAVAGLVGRVEQPLALTVPFRRS